MRAGSSAARGTRGYSDSGRRDSDNRRDWGRDRGRDADRGDRDYGRSWEGHRERDPRDRGRDHFDSRSRGHSSGYDARESRRGGTSNQYRDRRRGPSEDPGRGHRQRGGDNGAAGIRGKRAPSRSKSPRSKSARAKAEHKEDEEKTIMAAFQDLMTEEEREAKELEERRLKRAAIQAKLIAEQAEKEASQKQNGDAVSNGAGADASGEGNTDASNKAVGNPPVTDATQPQRVDMPQERDTARQSDGEDPVMIDSDAEGQQAEDLFRETAQQNVGDNAKPAKPVSTKAGAEEEDKDGDLFASDDESDERRGAQVDGAAEAPVNDDRRDARQAENFRKANTGLNDMYDDSQGYYNFRVGELMGSRYEVIKASGKGVFSSVVTAADKLRQDADGNNPLVAIKVIRANDTMYKAGKLELSILNKLAEEDPDNRRHVIRLLRNFEYRNHLCLVFEHMEMNLRELTRKVGVGRGIRIDAVGQLALQMLVALKHLRSTNVLHADIKPDNILINSRMNKIKLCDLGSATFAGSHNEPTPYLVSRFYRAPEVILGLPYDFPMDMWSIACTVYELFTAEILFKGRNNNEMLKLIMDLKGPMPKRMIKKGMFSSQHFAGDANLSFISVETDVVTKEPVKRLVSNVVKKRSLLQLLMRVTAKEFGGNIPKDELRKVENLAIFLDRATALEPASRLTPEEAMQTKFIMSVKQSIASSQSASKNGAKKLQS